MLFIASPLLPSSISLSLSHALSRSRSLAYSHRDECTHMLFRFSASLSQPLFHLRLPHLFLSSRAIKGSVSSTRLFSCIRVLGREHSFGWYVAPDVSPSEEGLPPPSEFRGSKWFERSWSTGGGSSALVLTCEMGERLAGETWIKCRGKRISDESQNTWRCCLVRLLTLIHLQRCKVPPMYIWVHLHQCAFHECDSTSRLKGSVGLLPAICPLSAPLHPNQVPILFVFPIDPF